MLRLERVVLLALAGCAVAAQDPATPDARVALGVVGDPVPAALPPNPDAVFADFLAAPIPVADGFSLPVFGWHPCGDGCWTTDTSDTSDTSRRVSAVANGTVRAVAADTVVTEHLFYDDQVKRTIWLRWEGVTPAVTAGATLKRGDRIGNATRLRLTAPDEPGPIEPFLLGRPRLPVPQAEPVLALVSHELRQMRIYRDGLATGTYEVGLGQEEGDKERRGDNRTPKGVYHVILRSKGPFDGPYGAYYGGHWIKLGYPNPWDAARGVDEGLFDTEMQRAITRAFWDRRMPPQGTKLGGGIGLHGWAYEWTDEGPRGMSWGCVVLHLRDVATLYDTLAEGTMVVMF